MKKTIFRTLAVSLASIAALSLPLPCGAAETAQGSGKLNDVLVKEKDSLRIEREKTPFNVDVNELKVLAPSLETDAALLNRRDRLLSVSTAAALPALESRGTISPWLHAIARGQVITFQFSGDKGKTDRWELTVVDTEGVPFRRFSGKGPGPHAVEWDGRSEKGEFVRVGSPYSYFLAFYDKAGKRRTGIAKPFTVEAALHQEKQGLFMHISPKLLFGTGTDAAVIASSGTAVLDEAADIVRENYPTPFAVRVYDESEARSLQRAQEIARYLAAKVMLPENKVGAEGRRTAPENYSIEILIRNRSF